ncbi:MAG: DUF3108 domain-containing protein [Candidatus Krumholzibacteriales bacterium]
MMNTELTAKKVLITALLLAAACCIGTGAGSGEEDSNIEGFRIVKPLPDSVYFGVGEKLVYAIQYGLIYAGDATLEIRNIAVLDSVKAYHIVSLARTNRAFDVVYKVRDHHKSFIDYDNLYSVRFEKHLREGRFRRDESVTFDQKKHLAIYEDKEVGIPPMTQDFLSALYYVRTVDLEIGDAVYLANHTGGKNYPIYVKVIGREQVEVPAGRFDCIVIEPVLKTSSIFKHEGKLTIWITDDNLKMPVLLRSKVVVGSFEARLKEYTLSDDEPRIPLISREIRNVK